jgi:hypothetical protein
MEHDSEPVAVGAPTRSPRARLRRTAGRLLLALILFAMSAWCVPAILWSNLPQVLRPLAAILFVAVLLAMLALLCPWRKAVFGILTAFVLVLGWWLLIPPSNQRDWQPDVAVLASATVDGNTVTIHNLRTCDYRSETDFDVHHEDRTYHLDKLQSADLYLVYWGSPSIAHTMLSFGFEGDEYVCISIETRKEKGENYSAVKGFFKQYELVYVVADERDLVRLRTNYRNEDVHLYRLRTPADVTRSVFLDYLREVNALNHRPEWYNALTQNCTTSIRGHTRPYANRRWPGWRTVLTGYVDELGYENGALDQSLPFAELKSQSRINERACAAGADPAFSRLIREGLPGMENQP